MFVRAVIALSIIASVVASGGSEERMPILRQEIIDAVNRANSGWKAGVNTKFMVT